jgi:SAM-dependent methyltransferase
MIDFRKLEKILVCPSCRGKLAAEGDGLRCPGCVSSYKANPDGFVEFRVKEVPAEVYAIDITTEDYVEHQEIFGSRMYREYLRPLLAEEPAKRVLDVGCGIGNTVCLMNGDGYEGYGIDLPPLSRYWKRFGFSPCRYFGCDATRLPFQDNFFDFVCALGVIEHIGTKLGLHTLADGYREMRLRFAVELLRVTRPGGRIVVSCPNKRFPVDIQHTPADASTRRTLSVRIRDAVCRKTGMNIHPVWGKIHFLSYSETRRLFCTEGGARRFQPMPLKGFFGFCKFQQGRLRPFAKAAAFYVDHVPGFLRSSFLNPYMLVQIGK